MTSNFKDVTNFLSLEHRQADELISHSVKMLFSLKGFLLNEVDKDNCMEPANSDSHTKGT